MGTLLNWEEGAIEDIAELTSYKLPASKAGAITGRRFTQWYPAGSATYSSSGTRSLRFQISGDGQGMLLPGTVQLKCQFNNLNATTANVLASGNGLLSAFARLRVWAGSSVEDISDYARCVSLMRLTGSKEVAENRKVCQGAKDQSIPAGGSVVLSAPLLSGLYFCEKALPLRALGSLVYELELTPDATEMASHAWSLTDCTLAADFIDAPDIEQLLSARILKGSSIPISMTTFFATNTAITAGGSESINISRSLSKLKRIWVTFRATADSVCDTMKKPTGPFEFGVRIGGLLVPQEKLKDTSMFWYQLTKSMGAHMSPNTTLNITKSGYESNTFVICLSTEKMEGLPWAGLSLKNEAVTLTHKNAGGCNFEHVVLEYEQVLSLGEVNETLD